jgi:hypothetical protein
MEHCKGAARTILNWIIGSCPEWASVLRDVELVQYYQKNNKFIIFAFYLPKYYLRCTYQTAPTCL